MAQILMGCDRVRSIELVGERLLAQRASSDLAASMIGVAQRHDSRVGPLAGSAAAP